MWIAHYAPGIFAKAFAPNVPLWVLALAGSLPDATHFILNFAGIESFNYDSKLANRGCFPYSNDYPFSHSLLGIIVMGIAYVLLYSSLSDRRVTTKDRMIVLGTVISHFFLELPVHRPDMKITPHDQVAIGHGLFNHPIGEFVLETSIISAAFAFYKAAAPPVAQAGAKRKPYLPNLILAILVAAQAHFCFGSAPTNNSRLVHAPLFLGQILFSCFLIGRMD